MDFVKIQVTKKNTLNVVYKESNGNLVSIQGANLVHKDLKACMNVLIAHLAIATEQRETVGKTLKEIEAIKIQDDNKESVYKWLGVEAIAIGSDESTYTLKGFRILQTGDVMKIETPAIDVSRHEKYQYINDLALAVDAVKYEAEAYLKEQKWGVKEADIDFGEDDPFKAENLTADQVPEANVGEQPEQPAKGKKAKTKKLKSA
jgi:hypothetical protein